MTAQEAYNRSSSNSLVKDSKDREIINKEIEDAIFDSRFCIYTKVVLSKGSINFYKDLGYYVVDRGDDYLISWSDPTKDLA